MMSDNQFCPQFFEGQVYDWGRFQNTGPHNSTQITPSSPPEIQNPDAKRH